MSNGRSPHRKGDWIQTFTGKKFWLLDPSPDDVCIQDIAHSLSLLCRFNGHCRQFYSVAEHSVRVAQICKPEHAYYGLMHDATEAYCGDVTRPLKPHLSDYAEIEYNICQVIAKAFNYYPIYQDTYENVKWADNTLLVTEGRDLVLNSVLNFKGSETAIEEKIVPWYSLLAEKKFLEMFDELFPIIRRA